MKITKMAKAFVSGLLPMAMLLTSLSGVGMVSANADDSDDSYVKAYEKAPYEETCDIFTLTVNGKPVDVVKYFDSRYSYAHLALEGTATFQVKLKSGQAIASYDISPHSYDLNDSAVADGDSLTFELNQAQSRYLIIAISTSAGQLRNLAIAADPKDTEVPPVADGDTVIDITQAPYNADATGAQPTSDIIQRAVEDIGAKGGGTVYFPRGVYQFTYIDFTEKTSNVTLYLDEGAVLRGSSNRSDYEWNGSGSGNIQGRRNILFEGGVKNVAIKGRGMIDANSTVLVEPKPGQKPTGWDDYRKGIIDAYAKDGTGPDGITLSGITVKDATGWTFSLNDCRNVTITHLKMLNDDSFVHSDGYDICASENVLVDQCFGYTGDDVFCAKGNRADYTMRDIVFQNGVAYADGGAGCKVGVQAKSNASNIVFQNIDVIQGYRGFSVSHDEGAGTWENIKFIDIRTEKLHVANPSDTGQYRAAPFVIWTLQRNGEIGTASGIEVTRCTIENAAGLRGIIKGETANGQPGLISDVKITDLVMDGQSVTEENYLRKVTVGANVQNLTFENTEIIEPAYTVYEAETGETSGGAAAVAASTCSGGWKVGSLGGGSNGSCTIQHVYAKTAGRYMMTVYYSTYTNRSFYVAVNDEEAFEMVCEGNGVDWTTISAISIPVRLNKGDNTIRFDNPTGSFAPDLDKIEIDNESLDPPPTPGVVYVSDLKWESATSGWAGHNPQRDLSIDGNPLRIRMSAENQSAAFAKGIGTHAVSEIVIDVSDLACQRFQCYVGPDVEATASNKTSVDFTVYVDDTLAFASGTMKRDSDAQYVDIDITGAKKLRLIAGDNGDGVSNDHADWADAKIITTITAQDIADTLLAPAVRKGDTQLSMPAVPEGFTVALTGSSSETIGLDGTITPPVNNEKVTLTFTVTKTETGESGTAELLVTVPGVGAPEITAQDIADTLRAPAIQKGDTQLPMPAVPEGFIVALTGSSSKTVSLDGTITPPETDERVTLTFTVKKEGSDQEGTATVVVTVPGIGQPPVNSVTGVTIQPKHASVSMGDSLQFTAQVEGEGQVDQSVLWAVEGQASDGTLISQDGRLTVADDETSACLTVTAISQADSSVSDSVTVSLYLKGDLDGNGSVTIADVMEACKILARRAAGTEPTEAEMLRGNLDGDEAITIADVMEICKILARKA